ncbi:ChaN family lipoprotein [Halodesulfovibrio aestuarii]|uniref:ChaN family lipoprotein n=1 Tax=Halodesulfovibrio aestuarii TaxID=126333 RepID=UPI00041DAAB7
MGLALRILFSVVIIMGGCALAQPPLSLASSVSAVSKTANIQPDKPSSTTHLPIEGEFFNANGSKASLTDVIAIAKSCDYILIGETHNVTCDHIVQAKIIAALAESGMRITVGMEMFAQDKQPQLDAVNNGDVSLTEFPKKVDWKEAWGFPYPLYEPIIDVIYKHKIKLYALNFPFEIARKIGDDGMESLTPEERQFLPEKTIPSLKAQEEELARIHDKHVELMTKDKDDPKAAEVAKKSLAHYRKRFFLIQSMWDTCMAEQAVKIRKKTKLPMVILSGRGHVEHGWGISYRLSKLDPDAKVLLVVPWRDTRPLVADEGHIQFYCPLTKQSRLGFTLRMESDGATIIDVADKSAAYTAGFLVGDKIVKVSGMDVTSMMTLHRAGVKAAKEGKDMVFTVIRGDKETSISMPVPEHSHSS